MNLAIIMNGKTRRKKSVALVADRKGFIESKVKMKVEIQIEEP